MRIIIEGPDGVGKTTVAQELARIFNLDYVHFDRTDPRDYEFYKQSLRKNNVLYDRNFISELIYPEFYNSDRLINDNEAHQLLKIVATDPNTYIFVLTGDPLTIRRQMKSNEPIVLFNSVEKIKEKYEQLAAENHFVVLNATKFTLPKLIEVIGLFVRRHIWIATSN